MSQNTIDRAMSIIKGGVEEKKKEELIELSVGELNALLLNLRELTFGPQLDCYAECPQCSQRLEFSISINDVVKNSASEDAAHEYMVETKGFKVHCRVPKIQDLLDLLQCNNAAAGREFLLKRCIVQSFKGEKEINIKSLPRKMIAAIDEKLNSCDPLCEIQIDIHCPDCGHHWSTVLDIISFFWAEVAANAKSLLNDIHTLAWAYGWREEDILAMSIRRRQLYMEMIV